MFRSLIRHPTTQSFLAGLIGRYLGFCYRTTRWTLVGEANILPHARRGEPLIVAFWHERLPMMPMLWTVVHAQYPETAHWVPHVLVSQHRDGRFIGDIVSRFRLVMIHGSTSRGGAAAMRAMLKVLREGSPVAITPDGPRGPRRVSNEGAAQIAGLSRIAVLPTAASTRRHKLLPSWDRMMLPLPFTRGVLVCGEPVRVDAKDSHAGAEIITTALNEACRLADSWIAGTDSGVTSRRV